MKRGKRRRGPRAGCGGGVCHRYAKEEEEEDEEGKYVMRRSRQGGRAKKPSKKPIINDFDPILILSLAYRRSEANRISRISRCFFFLLLASSLG